MRVDERLALLSLAEELVGASDVRLRILIEAIDRLLLRFGERVDQEARHLVLAGEVEHRRTCCDRGLRIADEALILPLRRIPLTHAITRHRADARGSDRHLAREELLDARDRRCAAG